MRKRTGLARDLRKSLACSAAPAKAPGSTSWVETGSEEELCAGKIIAYGFRPERRCQFV
jgi:hypothetical protein